MDLSRVAQHRGIRPDLGSASDKPIESSIESAMTRESFHVFALSRSAELSARMFCTFLGRRVLC